MEMPRVRAWAASGRRSLGCCATEHDRGANQKNMRGHEEQTKRKSLRVNDNDDPLAIIIPCAGRKFFLFCSTTAVVELNVREFLGARDRGPLWLAQFTNRIVAC